MKAKFILAGCLMAIAAMGVETKFINHGSVTNTAGQRGTVLAVDADGREVILSFLSNANAVYELVQIDAETGNTTEVKLPVKANFTYGVALSSRNKLYSFLAGHILEYDPVLKKFTACHKVNSQSFALSLREDKQGRIWVATTPNCHLICYDPVTDKAVDFGSVNGEFKGMQLINNMAVGDDGWIYVSSQYRGRGGAIIAFNSENCEIRKIHNQPLKIVRYEDGTVWGSKTGNEGIVCRDGAAGKSGRPSVKLDDKVKAHAWTTLPAYFPSGKILKSFDVPNRNAVVYNPATKENRTIRFDYHGGSAHIMGLAVVNDKIYGSTAMPMRFFSFDPKSGEKSDHDAMVQLNCLLPHGTDLYIGAYTGGIIFKYDTTKPWEKVQIKNVDDVKNPKNNPAFFGLSANPNRPHTLAMTPDEKNIIMAGGEGKGGITLFNIQSGECKIIKKEKHSKPNCSTFSVLPLSNTQFLACRGGAAGSLYIYDIEADQVVWECGVPEDIKFIFNILPLPDDKALLLCNNTSALLLFDIKKRELLQRLNLPSKYGQTFYQQGNRGLLRERDRVYLLTTAGVAVVNYHKLNIDKFIPVPNKITAGGTILDGRLYFAALGDICSIDLSF